MEETQLSIGEETVALRPDELDLLLERLPARGVRDGDAIRAEIGAL